MPIKLKGKKKILVNAGANGVPTTNIFAWWDASNASNITNVSGAASQLNDISGNNRHLVQGTSGSRPVVNAAGGSNGRGYLDFSGGKTMAVTGLPSTNNWTVYVMLKQPTWVNSGRVMQFNNTYDAIVNLVLDTQNVQGFQNNAQSGASYGNMSRPQWQLISVTFSPTGTQYRINDEPLISDTFGAVVNNMIQVVVGGASIDLQFSEAILYTGRPNTTDDKTIRNYFYSKYLAPRNKNIIYFGDSITRGEAATNYNRLSFAAKTAIDKGYNFYNFGVSGAVVAPWATYGIPGNGFSLSDLYTKAQQDYYSGNIVISSYGTNDAGSSNTSDALWKSQYKALLTTIIGYGYSAGNVVVATPPYQSARPTMPSFNSNISAIASELGAIYGNVYNYTQANGGDGLLADGIHPTNTGHDTIATYLKTLIPTA